MKPTEIRILALFLAGALLAPATASAEFLSLSAEYGAWINSAGTSGNTYYLAPRVQASMPVFLDFLSVEAGVAYYQVQNLLSVGDNYNVLPLEGTLRATLPVGPVKLFAYAGLLKNIVLSGGSTLSTAYPAFGGGVLVPWGAFVSLRADAGYDGFGGGVNFSF